jgi:hypothetical protein
MSVLRAAAKQGVTAGPNSAVQDLVGYMQLSDSVLQVRLHSGYRALV